ncbi:MAG: TadE/TadG family type IV pilus assembly protein [Candidatus Dormibacteria bacterium]
MRTVARVRRLRRARSRGQSIVEFSLAGLFLVLVLVGAAQFGLVYYDSMAVETAAREATRVAAEQPVNSGLFSNPNSPSSPGQHICSGSADSNVVCAAAYKSTYKLPDGLLDPTKLSVSMQASSFAGNTATTCPMGTGTSDGQVSVTVSFNAPLFVPFINTILGTDAGNTYHTVTSTTTIRVEPCDVTLGS